MVILLFGALSACGSGGPDDIAAATVTAPVTMPVMIFEARRNGREAFLERARGNRRPLPPLDPESRMMADAALRQALDRGDAGKGIYWENGRGPERPTRGHGRGRFALPPEYWRGPNAGCGDHRRQPRHGKHHAANRAPSPSRCK